MEHWDNGKIEDLYIVTAKKQIQGRSTTSSERVVELGSLYDITTRRKDYVNPTIDGEKSWRSVCSYNIDSKDAPDRRQNRLHEVSSRRCARITKHMRWIGSEI